MHSPSILVFVIIEIKWLKKCKNNPLCVHYRYIKKITPVLTFLNFVTPVDQTNISHPLDSDCLDFSSLVENIHPLIDYPLITQNKDNKELRKCLPPPRHVMISKLEYLHRFLPIQVAIQVTFKISWVLTWTQTNLLIFFMNFQQIV